MPADVLQQHAKGTFRLSHRRDVRGQQYVGMVPEGMVRWRRLLLEDIQHRGAELAVGKGFKQVLFHQVPTSAHVDQRCALGQVLEQLAVEDPSGLFGQRQDAQHNLALAEKGRQLLVASKARHPVDVMFATGPTG